MNLELLKQELIHFEGYKNTVYKDSVGLLTAGIGHLLPQDGTYTEGQEIGLDKIQAWFCQDIQTATTRLQNIIGQSTMDDIDEFRQRVLVQLTFNLGNRFAGFRNTIKCIHNADWTGAADNLKDSYWYNQVGNRGPETCNALINGKYSWE
jgi:lysozyme